METANVLQGLASCSSGCSLMQAKNIRIRFRFRSKVSQPSNDSEKFALGSVRKKKVVTFSALPALLAAAEPVSLPRLVTARIWAN